LKLKGRTLYSKRKKQYILLPPVGKQNVIYFRLKGTQGCGDILLPPVRKMIFSIKVFVILLDYLKILQVAMLGDLHV
jgi:hypothetical protein